MKVFGMVGMHDAGFARLVRALDEYAGRHPEDEVWMQIGSTDYAPRHARSFPFKPSLDEDLRRCDVVVSHGSICVFDALQLGKRLVAVPRLSGLGEHMNDHQVRSSCHFSDRYGFPVVLEITELEAAITNLKASPPPPPVAFQTTGLYDQLGKYLESLMGPPPGR